MIFSTIFVYVIEKFYTTGSDFFVYEGNYVVFLFLLSAGDVNILDNKKIVVSVGNFDSDSRIVLINNDTGDNVYTLLKFKRYKL